MSSFEQNSKEITNRNGIISLSIVDGNRLKTKKARDFEKYSHFRSFIAKRALFIVCCYSTSAYIWIEVPWEEIACLLNTLFFPCISILKREYGRFFRQTSLTIEIMKSCISYMMFLVFSLRICCFDRSQFDQFCWYGLSGSSRSPLGPVRFWARYRIRA